MSEHVRDEALDFRRLSLDIDLKRLAGAKVADGTRDPVVVCDVEHAVAEADPLDAPCDANDLPNHRGFFRTERGAASGTKGRGMTEEDALAERAAEAMYERDQAARAMGIEILEVRAGFARVAFTVREDMLNGHAICHGAYIFGLADTAFAYACNSRGDACVALQCSISFAVPGRAGARLTATARERARGGRTGTYDVEIADDAGDVLVFFRGTSYRVAAKVV